LANLAGSLGLTTLTAGTVSGTTVLIISLELAIMELTIGADILKEKLYWKLGIGIELVISILVELYRRSKRKRISIFLEKTWKREHHTKL
jgi:hypothetical protein